MMGYTATAKRMPAWSTDAILKVQSQVSARKENIVVPPIAPTPGKGNIRQLSLQPFQPGGVVAHQTTHPYRRRHTYPSNALTSQPAQRHTPVFEKKFLMSCHSQKMVHFSVHAATGGRGANV